MSGGSPPSVARMRARKLDMRPPTSPRANAQPAAWHVARSHATYEGVCPLTKHTHFPHTGCTLPHLLTRLTARLPTAGYTRLDPPTLADLGAAMTAGPIAAGDVVVEGETPLARALASSPPPPLRLTPSLPLWRAIVGLSDDDLCTHAPSAAQLDALEVVARARGEGVLRPDLARARGADPRNFHFVITHLAARGLVTATKVLLAAARGRPAQSTARLHLPRYAPRLGPAAVLREGGASTSGGVRDDAASVATVCARLAAIAPAATPDADLKRMLGLPPGQAGNRAWRRLRTLLVTAGYARTVTVRLGGGGGDAGDAGFGVGRGAARGALVAASPWDGGEALAAASDPKARAAAAAATDDPPADPGAEAATAFALAAEQGLDAQLGRLLAEGGRGGVPVAALARAFGTHRAKSRLEAARDAVGALESSRQLGKAVMRFWALPEAALAAARAAAPPAQPRGGFLAAVAAAAGGASPVGLAPLTAGQQEQAAAGGPSPPWPATPARGGRGAAPAAPAPPPDDPSSLLLDIALPPPPPAPVLDPTEEAELDDVLADAAFAVDAPPRAAAAGGTATLAHSDRLGPQQEARLRLLAAAVTRDGFILRARLARLLAEAEGGAVCARPDRRTLDRIIAAGAARGVIGLVQLTMPYGAASTAGGAAAGAARAAGLVVAPSATEGLAVGARAPVPPDVQRGAVAAAFFGFRGELRRAQAARATAAAAAAAAGPGGGGGAERVAVVRSGPGVGATAARPAETDTGAPPLLPSLPTPSPRDKVAAELRTMLANGYARGCLARAARLHGWLCEHAAAGGGGRAGSATPSPAAVGGVAFSVTAALDCMPLAVLRAVVGCKGDLGAALRRCGVSATLPLGDAPLPVASAARDAASERRLDAAVQLLRRLGLVRLHLGESSGSSRAPPPRPLCTVVPRPRLLAPTPAAAAAAADDARDPDDVEEGASLLEEAAFDVVRSSGGGGTRSGAAPPAAVDVEAVASVWRALRRYSVAPPAAAAASPLSARVPELAARGSWRGGVRSEEWVGGAPTPARAPARAAPAPAPAPPPSPPSPPPPPPPAAPPTTTQPAPPATRKVRWSEAEDRAVLRVYASHVLSHGRDGPPPLRRASRLPGVSADERQGTRRLDRLRRDGATGGLVAALDETLDAARVEGVAARSSSPPPLPPRAAELIDAIVDVAPLRPPRAGAGAGTAAAPPAAAPASPARRPPSAPSTPPSPAPLPPAAPAPACFEDDAGEAVLAERSAAGRPTPPPPARAARAARAAAAAPRDARAVAALETLRAELYARRGARDVARATADAVRAVDAAHGGGTGAAAASALAAAGHAGRGGRGLSDAYTSALSTAASLPDDAWHEAAAVASALRAAATRAPPRLPAPLCGPLAVLTPVEGGLTSPPATPVPLGALAVAAGRLADGSLCVAPAALAPGAVGAAAAAPAAADAPAPWDGGLVLTPVDAPPSPPTPVGPPPRKRARAAAAAAAPTPWTRADGAPDATLFAALARRAVAAVAAAPGLPEDGAVGALGALCGPSARALLARLVAVGLLTRVDVPSGPAPGPPTVLGGQRSVGGGACACYFLARGDAVARVGEVGL